MKSDKPNPFDFFDEINENEINNKLNQTQLNLWQNILKSYQPQI